jgi:hypothetical protein
MRFSREFFKGAGMPGIKKGSLRSLGERISGEMGTGYAFNAEKIEVSRGRNAV